MPRPAASPASKRERANPRLFLDTSVLFAAVLSPTGGARLVLKLGEAGVASVVVGPRVLAEIDGVITRKAPQFRAFVALMLDGAAVEVGPPADAASSEAARGLISYAPDAAILAEVLAAKIDYFVSLDRAHFVGNATLDSLPFRVGTPGQCLAWLRDRLHS